MDTSDHARVGKALHLLKESLGPFVEREVRTALDSGRLNMETLIEKLQNDPNPHARKLWNGPITDLDIAGLFRLMKITWKDLFHSRGYSKLGQTELNLIYELSNYRNKWAHQEKLSSDDIYRFFDSSERLARAISATQEAEVLMQFKIEQLQTLADNNKQDTSDPSKHHIEGEQTIPSRSSGSAREGFLQAIHTTKKNHRGKPEDLTRTVAKIILKECLGLRDEQIVDEFPCHYGPLDTRNGRVDIAATYEDINSKPVKKFPKILLELKKTDRKFVFGTKNYFEDVDQLKRYMNSKNCQTVEHGIIFNINQLQIFRKHGKLIYPITKVIDFLPKNITDQEESIHKIVSLLKAILVKQPHKYQTSSSTSTIITIYNNKGGVGKTTTVSYLSYFLGKKSDSLKQRMNKILVIDYDHNQGNLTKRFGFDKTDGEISKLLFDIKKGKNIDQLELNSIKQVRFKEDKEHAVINFLAADQTLDEESGTYDDVFNFNGDNCLKKLCLELAKKYDYIIIDTPPGWEQNPYARAAVTAADCLLTLGKWGDFDSFDGYRSVICDKLPQISQIQYDMKPNKPHDLGLWITDARSSDQLIEDMTIREFEYHISQAESNKEELRRGFFDSQNGNKLRVIKHSALILKSSCHNSESRKDFLKTCHYSQIDKAYKKLLNSFIGG